jgi:hypothetical protein
LFKKGVGVLGIALVGYTYILEQMGIAFGISWVTKAEFLFLKDEANGKNKSS